MDPALGLIRTFEGFRETPYWDVNALRTGYGSDTVTLADGRVVPVTADTRVTREDAERDLARRVQTEFIPRAAQAVGREAWSALSPSQKAALASITYNYGSLPDSVAAAVRSGDPMAAAEAIRALGSHNDGVNAKRRSKEAAIYAGQALPEGGVDEVPQLTDRNPIRLAMAYASGRMTPEDAALYEEGMAAGVFPKVEKRGTVKVPESTALSDYAAQIAERQRNRAPVQITPLESITSAAPYARFPGLGA
jgi:GH24 family phage-related lysozyme (muramidase)